MCYIFCNYNENARRCNNVVIKVTLGVLLAAVRGGIALICLKKIESKLWRLYNYKKTKRSDARAVRLYRKIETTNGMPPVDIPFV